MLLIVLLIIINVAQLGAKYIYHKHPHNPRDKNLKIRAPKLLGLDESQKHTFFGLAGNHREKILKLQEQQHELTLSYINNPSTPVLDEIANIHKQKIILTENHFSDVYNILNEAQKSNFSRFKQAALKVIIH